MGKSKSILTLSKEAENVWYMLHGVFAVYKPPGEHIEQVRNTLKVHLCRDMNKLKTRPPGDYVQIEGPTNKPMTVTVGPSFADHPLLLGPRYQLEDVKIYFANRLPTDCSGLLICGINNGWHTIKQLREARPTKFYKVKGILGKATSNFFVNGRVVEKTTFKHVRREHIDKICATMQSSHQKNMFDACGVPRQSQAAYELAVQGPIRPASEKIPMMYSLKCVDFNPPEFTLEIVCVNEDDMFLKEIVHTLGWQARSTAACSQIQCFRYGIVTTENALLKKHWNLEGITYNMAFFRDLLRKNRFMMKPRDPILKEYSSLEQIEEGSVDQPIAIESASAASTLLDSPENIVIENESDSVATK